MESGHEGSLFAIAHANGRLMFSTTIKATVSSSPRRAAASRSGNTGFICPLCHDMCKDLDELLAHQKQCERNRMWQKSRQFASLFASIDFVQNAKPIHHNLFLGQVDTFDHAAVFAFVTVGHYQMLLAHNKTYADEDSVRTFFALIHSHLVKVLLNPFQSLDGKILSPAFAKTVQDVGQQHLALP